MCKLVGPFFFLFRDNIKKKDGPWKSRVGEAWWRQRPLVVAVVEAGATEPTWGIAEGVFSASTYLSSKELSTKERPFPGHGQVDADALGRGAALQGRPLCGQCIGQVPGVGRWREAVRVKYLCVPTAALCPAHDRLQPSYLSCSGGAPCL